MLVSYWDAGYVQLDVTDPAHPDHHQRLGVRPAGSCSVDPRTGEGFEQPEGSGHQAEFSYDNRFVLAADEDFLDHRLPSFEITTGPNVSEFPAASSVGPSR